MIRIVACLRREAVPMTQRQFDRGGTPTSRISATAKPANPEGHALLALQRQAGNRAVVSMLGDSMRTVQRCGRRDCADCGPAQDDESSEHGAGAVAQRVSEIVVQRDGPANTPQVQARVPQHRGR
jgi:hypothetical protein